MPQSWESRKRTRRYGKTRSALQGSKSFRRLLRAMPDATRAELADALEEVGPQLQSIVQGRAKKKTGELAGAITWKVLRRSLSLRVGLLTKRARRQHFYGYILNWGRKAKAVTAKRRTAGGISSYIMNVRGFGGDRFVTGAYKDLRRKTADKLRGIWERALRRAAAGAGNE